MLSQTTEYALRAMACLAYTPDRLMPTPLLAEITKVPSNYLAKVLQSLVQSHLVEGRRGVGGGYRLARPAQEITILDVVRAMDSLDRIKTCPLGLKAHGSQLCNLHRMLDEAVELVVNHFDGVTLQDLMGEHGSSHPLCDTETSARLGITRDGKAVR